MLLRSVLLTTLLAGCRDAAPPPPEFDGDRALAYVQTQLDFGPRIPGTEGHAPDGGVARLAAPDPGRFGRRPGLGPRDRGRRSLPLRNLIARFNPGATTRLLFLAHWDTRPRADAAGSRGHHRAGPRRQRRRVGRRRPARHGRRAQGQRPRHRRRPALRGRRGLRRFRRRQGRPARLPLLREESRFRDRGPGSRSCST